MYVLDRLKIWTFLSASLVPACFSLSLSVVGKFRLTRCYSSKMLVHTCRPNSSHDSTCILLLDLLPRSETSCEKCCLPHSCSTARRLMFENELAKRAQTRTNVAQHSDDTLTASTDHRRWDTHESETTHSSHSRRDTELTKMRELQSGERARTTTTTQNTCSSPGYPVTTDLSHFP